MIFASDLDRTLIYSKNFISNNLNNLSIVETKDSEIISYMSNKSINLLKLINDKLLFIPTTTRSYEQYMRITLFQTTIKPKYAIVANGGILLKDNIVDKTFAKKIETILKTYISPNEMINKCKFFLENKFIKSYKVCDNTFLYAVLKEYIAENNSLFIELTETCKKYDYNAYLHGKKIYIIPTKITKYEPLKYIMDIEEDFNLISAGDSILDLPMLSNSNMGIIPSHGELYKLYKETLADKNNLRFTQNEGFSSSEEFLDNILKSI